MPARSLGTVFGTVYIFPYAAEVIAYAAGAAVFAAVGARSVLLISGFGVLAMLALVAPMLSGVLSSTPGPISDERMRSEAPTMG